MATFEYVDKNGDNEYNAEASISVDVKEGTVHIGVFTSDLDGDSYTIYVPNHRVAILNLVNDLMTVLDHTDDWARGYDGFSTNFASATSSGDVDEWNEAGIVKSY